MTCSSNRDSLYENTLKRPPCGVQSWKCWGFSKEVSSWTILSRFLPLGGMLCVWVFAHWDLLLIGPLNYKKAKVSHPYPLEHNTSSSALPQAWGVIRQSYSPHTQWGLQVRLMYMQDHEVFLNYWKMQLEWAWAKRGCVRESLNFFQS